MQVELPAEIRKLAKKEGGFIPNGPVFNAGKVRNISAGGAQLFSFQPLDLGRYVRLAFNLPETGAASFLCGIVYAQAERDFKGREHFIYGLNFLGVDDEQRSHLLCFVLENQLKKR